MVVVLPPSLSDDACVLHGRALFAVHAFVLAFFVGSLDVTILPWGGRLDVKRF